MQWKKRLPHPHGSRLREERLAMMERCMFIWQLSPLTYYNKDTNVWMRDDEEYFNETSLLKTYLFAAVVSMMTLTTRRSNDGQV